MPRPRRLAPTAAVAAACACAVLAGCDGDLPRAGPGADAGSADAGADVSIRLPGPDESFAVPLPALPAPPDLGAPVCPAHWTATSPSAPADGPCLPPARVACEGASAQYAGDEGCRPVGTACPPDGGFPSEAEVRALAPGFPGSLVYVRATAGPGGDGSPEAPFAGLDGAFLAGPPPGTPIVLAPGTYEVGGEIPAGVAVVGSCASGTTLASPRSTGNAALLTSSDNEPTAVVNLTLTPLDIAVLANSGAGPVHLWSVVVDGGHGAAVLFQTGASGGSLVDVVVRGLRPDRRTGVGVAVYVRDGQVRLERVLVEHCAGTGVAAEPPGGGSPNLVLADMVVSDLLPAAGSGATGLAVRQGGTVSASRLLIERIQGYGIVGRGEVGQAEARLTAEDVLVRDIYPPPGGRLAIGVGAENATFLLRRVGIARVSDLGLYASEAPPPGEPGDATVLVEAEDVRIRDLGPPSGGAFSEGVLVQSGARLVARRLRIDGVSGNGVRLVGHAGLELADGVVHDLERSPRESGGKRRGGWGVVAFDGPTAALTRVLVDGAREFGVLASAEGVAGTVLRLTDVAVRDVRPAETAMAAGVAVLHGAEVTLERVLVSETVGAGLFASRFSGAAAPASVTLDGLTVADVRSATDETNGAGVMLFEGTRLSGRGLVIERAPGVGLSVRCTDPAMGLPHVELEDVVVRDTASTLLAGRFGHGVEAADGAQVVLRRVLVEGNRRVGVVAGGWTGGLQTRVTLEDLVVRGTAPAACSALPPEDEHRCHADGRDEGGGSALAVLDGARLQANDFLLTESAGAGLLVASDGWARLQRGRITANTVGVNLMVPDFDTAQLTDEVYVFGNQTEVAAQDLPLPEPARMVAELALP